MKRAALYVRVSTQEQKNSGLSVDNQIDSLKEYCQANNLEVYDIYSDAGISAHISYKKRPALLRMIDDCQNKKIDIVLVTRLDRFFRSVPDYYAVIEKMNGVPWKTIWEDYETETSSGQFKVNIMLSIAEAEAARTSEKIRSVMTYKKERHEYVGRPPIGYRVVDGRIVKDPETSEMVNLMFRTYLSTWSIAKTTDALVAAGYKTHNDTLRDRLKNATYCGDAKGIPCEPYITSEQHEDIINNMKRFIRSTIGNEYDYIFTGMCTCGYCGHRLHARGAVHKLADGSRVKYRLYVCDGMRGQLHGRVMIGESTLQNQLVSGIDSMMVEAERKALTASKGVDSTKEIARLKGKLSRIAILFEEGDLDLEDYRKKRNEMQRKIRELETLSEPVKKVQLPAGWKDIYDDLSNIGKRQFWRSFICEIIITKENKNSISYDDVKFKMG